MGQNDFNVAIIGGGLCGITLAIALQNRGIPFTLYEARASFTEIGAGINIGPNGLQALRLIDNEIGDTVSSLATRNPPPYENTWMRLRYGAPQGAHQDGEVIMDLKAPGTGSSTMHRRELLEALAGRLRAEKGNVQFGKKLQSYVQDEHCVELRFEDGSAGRASVVIGCDGIHSRVRKTMFGPDSIVSRPHYSQGVAYRAVLPMDKVVETIGESARQATTHLGPGAYLIMYPVNSGSAVNCGAWLSRPGTWDHEEWVVPNQKEHFERDFRDWGPRAKKILALFDSNPDAWSSHHHLHQPVKFTDGRVMLIGDGAHSMPPHQGAGASQAVEDAYILAEVLGELSKGSTSPFATKAALQAVEEVRRPRFTMVHNFSSFSGPHWFAFWEQKLEAEALVRWKKELLERLSLIWDVDLRREAASAKQRFKALVGEVEDRSGYARL